MQLLVTIVIVGAIALADAAQPKPVENVAWTMALAGGLIVALLAQALAIRHVVLGSAGDVLGGAGDPTSNRPVREHGRFEQGHLIIWFALSWAFLCFVRWPAVVRHNWGLDRFVLLDEVLIVLPVLAPLVLSWFVFYDLELSRGVALAQSAGWGRALWRRCRFAWCSARIYLGLLLVPMFALILLRDLVGQFGTLQMVESTWVSLALLVALALGFPWCIRLAWRTESLPAGALRTGLSEEAQLRRVELADIRIWYTGGRITNALVAGFVPHLRDVLLSDRLLVDYPVEQIRAVFAHELAHIRGQHLWLRGALLVFAVISWLGLRNVCFGDSLRLEAEAEPAQYAVLSASLLLLVAILCFAWFVFGPYCRRLEHEADVDACRREDQLAPPADRDVEHYLTTLRRLRGRGGPDKVSWLHPSLSQRIDLIERLANDEQAYNRYCQHSRDLRRVVIVLTATATAIWSWHVLF